MELFTPLSSSVRNSLEEFETVLHSVLRPKATHLKTLPLAIGELSELLTERRSEIHPFHPYWSDVRLKSAYLWYFLPWNLVRLSPLLMGLDLNLKANDSILDLGSGPLTFPLALWIARPDLRETPLLFYCNDIQQPALHSGLALFQMLTGQNSPWKILLCKGGINDALKRARENRVNLLACLNTLNEIRPERKQGLYRMLEGLLRAMRETLKPGGHIFLVEPGNRLGGKIIETTREIALKQNLSPESPCPHCAPCPMLAPRSGTWCHFVQNNQFTPAWLLKLSVQAKLGKRHTALSFALLNAKKENIQTGPEKFIGRIISNPFKVPGMSGLARYACTSLGLTLIPDAAAFPSGALLTLKADAVEKDTRSGAILARPD